MRLCDFVNWELQMLNDKHIWKLLSEEEKKNYKPKIYDFVEWELQYFRDSCNFSVPSAVALTVMPL